MPSPTLLQLIERVRTDIELSVDGADAHIALGGFNELAGVWSSQLYSLHQKVDWATDQLFADSSDETYLLREANLLLEVPRVEAAYAQGNIDLTGVDGSTVPFGAIVQTAALVEYRTMAEVTIAAGVASVLVSSLEAGLAGNLAAAETLSFSVPVTGVDSTVTVDASGITGGADLEDMERVRERVGERKKQPPEGGALHDYVAWAKAAHVDVTRVWPFAHENGTGSIVVRFVTDNAATVIPDAAVITAVTDYIELIKPYNLKALTVEAPTALPLDITFTTLVPNTAEVQAAIVAELTDLLTRKAEPGATLYLSQVREAISRAADEDNYEMDLAVDITYTDDQVGTIGTIVFP